MSSEVGHSGRKDFSAKWIVGADSVRLSSIKSVLNIHRLYFLKQTKAIGVSYLSIGPLAKAFNIIGKEERKRLRVKFNIAYFITTEKITFTKYPKIICKDMPFLYY